MRFEPFAEQHLPAIDARVADLSFADIVAAGGHRVSVGGWLSWVGRRAVDEAARAILEQGDFSALG